MVNEGGLLPINSYCTRTGSSKSKQRSGASDGGSSSDGRQVRAQEDYDDDYLFELDQSAVEAEVKRLQEEADIRVQRAGLGHVHLPQLISGGPSLIIEVCIRVRAEMLRNQQEFSDVEKPTRIFRNFLKI